MRLKLTPSDSLSPIRPDYRAAVLGSRRYHRLNSQTYSINIFCWIEIKQKIK